MKIFRIGMDIRIFKADSFNPNLALKREDFSLVTLWRSRNDNSKMGLSFDIDK